MQTLKFPYGKSHMTAGVAPKLPCNPNATVTTIPDGVSVKVGGHDSFIERNTLQEYSNKLVGQTLNGINTACQMLMFDFDSIKLHASCFARIVRSSQILVTTADYQSWDGITDTENDEWYNLAKHKEDIISSRVCRVELTDTNDLFLSLENGVEIQIFITNSEPHFGDSTEQWRLLCGEELHIIVYNHKIELF